jgi:PKD repeat protein
MQPKAIKTKMRIFAFALAMLALPELVSATVIFPPPIACFYCDQPTVFVGFPAMFFDYSTGTITNWVWNLGDGTIITNPYPGIVTHSYTIAGNFNVTLTVYGPGGMNTLTQPDFITVIPPPLPVAGFFVTPTNGVAPLPVTFIDSSTGSIWSWVWNLGDGTIITNNSNVSIDHTYTVGGNFNITLTVSGPTGASIFTIPNCITVLPGIVSPPVIISQPQSQSSQVGLNDAFNVTASGTPPLNYQWRFNGQNILNATNATLTLNSVTAANDGGYSVVVSNPYGSATSANASLAVLTVDTTVPCYLMTATPLPDRQSGKNNLVVVTHGWQPTFLNLNGPPSQPWLDVLTNAISTNLILHGVNDWQVEKYEWLSDSWTFYPNDALENAKKIGTQIGNQIAEQGWQKVHLIAHSAGAELIQAATEAIRVNSPGTIIQETFLDPYTGPALEGRSEYGMKANWADDYFVFDLGTDIGGILYNALPFPYSQLQLPSSTSGQLKWAYNVDVGGTLQATQLPYYVGSGVADSTPAYVAVGSSPSHGTPIDFYTEAVEGTEPSCAGGYGFPLSLEAGGSGNWQNFPTNNSPYPLCGMASFSQNEKPVNVNSSLNLALQPIGTSSLGVNVSGGSATLSSSPPVQGNMKANGVKPLGQISSTTNSTGNTAWLAVGLTVTNPVNFVQFDAEFTDASSAEGLLTVYWDTNQIGTVDERVTSSGIQTYRFFLPNTVTNNVYVIGFRLDSFDTTSSSVLVTNVATGFVGVTQPITLGVSITNGAPMLQLSAATNFTYLVQSSTNLVDWTPTALLLNTNGTVQFTDSAVTNSGARFYRAVMP